MTLHVPEIIKITKPPKLVWDALLLEDKTIHDFGIAVNSPNKIELLLNGLIKIYQLLSLLAADSGRNYTVCNLRKYIIELVGRGYYGAGGGVHVEHVAHMIVPFHLDYVLVKEWNACMSSHVLGPIDTFIDNDAKKNTAALIEFCYVNSNIGEVLCAIKELHQYVIETNRIHPTFINGDLINVYARMSSTKKLISYVTAMENFL